ncbi:MAG: hypothetical protein ACAI18_08405 [Gemmatimonadales bacterium]
MVSPPESSAFPEHHPVQSSGEDARAFLQERLAFLGKAYGLIGLGFSFAGNLVSAPLRVLSGLTEDWSSRIVWSGSPSTCSSGCCAGAAAGAKRCFASSTLRRRRWWRW